MTQQSAMERSSFSDGDHFWSLKSPIKLSSKWLGSTSPSSSPAPSPTPDDGSSERNSQRWSFGGGKDRPKVKGGKVSNIPVVEESYVSIPRDPSAVSSTRGESPKSMRTTRTSYSSNTHSQRPHSIPIPLDPAYAPAGTTFRSPSPSQPRPTMRPQYTTPKETTGLNVPTTGGHARSESASIRSISPRPLSPPKILSYASAATRRPVSPAPKSLPTLPLKLEAFKLLLVRGPSLHVREKEVGEVLVTLDVGGTVFVTTAETLRRAGRLGDFVGSVLEGLRGSAGERVENEEERAVEREMESAEGDEESEGHFSFTNYAVSPSDVPSSPSSPLDPYFKPSHPPLPRLDSTSTITPSPLTPTSPASWTGHHNSTTSSLNPTKDGFQTALAPFYSPLPPPTSEPITPSGGSRPPSLSTSLSSLEGVHNSIRREQGTDMHIFLDRNGTPYGHILNYLRTGSFGSSIILPMNQEGEVEETVMSVLRMGTGSLVMDLLAALRELEEEGRYLGIEGVVEGCGRERERVERVVRRLRDGEVVSQKVVEVKVDWRAGWI